MVNQDTVKYKAYACMKKGEGFVPWEYSPRKLGADDVEIKISHCGICGSGKKASSQHDYTDIHTYTGGWGYVNYPCVVGHEIIGTVKSLGPNVTEFKVGDRVGVGAQRDACLSGSCSECSVKVDQCCPKRIWTYNDKYADGELAYGGYAGNPSNASSSNLKSNNIPPCSNSSHIRLRKSHVFAIPESIPSDVAAPLMCAGATTYTPLKRAGVKPGMSVGVIGIGGLGHLGLLFAKAMGATTVAFSSSNSKKSDATSLGATKYVNWKDDKEAKDARNSVDVLLITGNAADTPWDLFLSFVKTNGTAIIVALPESKISIHPTSLVSRNVTLAGSVIGGIHDIKDMLAFAAKHKVYPIIEKVPMSQVNEGIKKVDSNNARFRVVLVSDFEK